MNQKRKLKGSKVDNKQNESAGICVPFLGINFIKAQKMLAKTTKMLLHHLHQVFLFAQLFHPAIFTIIDIENEPKIIQLSIGAVFREHEDAHLEAAFNYTIHWLHTKQQERIGVAEDGSPVLLRLNGFIETMADPFDHYELLEKACHLVNEHDVIALIGPSDRHLSEQLVELTRKLHLPYFSLVDPLEHHHLDPAGNILPDSLPTVVPTNLIMFPQTQLLEALNDLIKYWCWHRLIVVYVEPERIRRLVMFLENDAFASIRFHLVHVEDGDHLKAAKMVKELEECDQELASSFQRRHGPSNGGIGECSEFSRLLLDMGPRDTHQFMMAALKVGLVEQKHWFLSTSLDIHQMDMELFRHNHAKFVGLSLATGEATGELPPFDEFLDHVKMNWLAKNSAEIAGEEGRINFRMSEAVLLFDSLYLLTTIFANSPSMSKSTKSSTNLPPNLFTSPARCPTGTQPIKPLENGQKFAKMLRTNRRPVRGMGGELAARFGGIGLASSNFTFRINLMGYAGQIEDIGFWQWDSEETPRLDMSAESRAQRHRKVKMSDELKPHFRVTTILERPYVMLKSHEFEHPMAGGGGGEREGMIGRNTAQFEGFCIDLLTELANDLGFTYTIHVVRDNKYGSDNGNGSWDGMIGEILHNQADMAVAPLTANFRRAEVVDFTKPFLSLGISIIFRIPEDYQPDIFSFLNPLSLEIWVCILLSIGGLTIGMYLVANVTPYEWNLNFSCCTAHQPHPAAQFSSTLATSSTMTRVELSNNYSFWNTLWYVMSTMLKGGCDFGPRAVSTRLLGGSWWVFTLVIVSAYTANLAAVLTVSRPHIPIRNIDDLANQSDISYGTINGGSTMQFFQESKIAAHAKMWTRMHRSSANVFVRNNREGVEKALREKYAFLMESSSLEYEVQQNCNLTQIGGVLGSKGYGIALQKNSEWTDRISRQILLYQKRGIVEMKKTKWWRSKGASCHGVGSSVKQQRISLNLQNVSGLFVILLLGLLLSVFIVAMEFYVRAKEQRHLFKNNNNNNQQDGPKDGGKSAK